MNIKGLLPWLVTRLEPNDGYWYLATPYSKYPLGLEMAFQHACIAAAELVNRGVRLYCPIAHTHPIAEYGEIEPRNHEIWLPLDKPLMDAARGLIVVKMPSWHESYGIKVETKTFREADKQVHYLDWPLT